MRFSNRVYYTVPDICDTDYVKLKSVNIVVLTRSKSKSVKYNNIYRRPRGYKGID
jgi:hypothetical protein